MSTCNLTDDDPIHWCNRDGFGVMLPPGCVGFRVRYWKPGARGPGELVLDDEGAPVLMPVRVTLPAFVARVGGRVGRYRLRPLDARYQFIPGIEAAQSISEALAARIRARRDADGVRAVLAEIERGHEEQRRAQRALVEMAGAVVAALDELRGEIDRGELVLVRSRPGAVVAEGLPS